MTLLTIEKLQEMARVQEELNQKFISPNWRNEKKPPFMLAFIAEFGEFLGHIETSWKWWKKPRELTETEKAQAFLEIVDCSHFFLSEFMEILEKEGEEFIKGINNTYQSADADPKASLLTGVIGAIETGNMHWLGAVLGDCCAIVDKTPADIHKWYCGKAALNHLRQDYGDKTATYIKHWPGIGEDNLYLEYLLKTNEYNSIDEIYEDLESKYKEVTNGG